MAAWYCVEPLSVCITRICLMRNVCNGCAEQFMCHHSQLGEPTSVCFSSRHFESPFFIIYVLHERSCAHAEILAGKMADFVAAPVVFQEVLFTCELHFFFF